MPEPLAICIEDLEPGHGPRFVRCVALVGRKPGLRLSNTASIIWQSDDDIACELWVSGDDRLILYRPPGAVDVRVSRGGRSLLAPFAKPVVLIHLDEVTVGSRRLRVHVHGEAKRVAPPSPLPDPARGPAARVAAIVALGAVVAGCDRPVEVRETPPAPPPQTNEAPLPASAEPPATAEPTTVPTEPATSHEIAQPPPATPSASTPIEVRNRPPDMIE